MRILVSYGLVGRGGDAVHVRVLAEAFRRLGHATRLLGPRPLQPYRLTGAESSLRNLLRRFPWWVRDVLEIGQSLHFLARAKRSIRGRAFDFVVHSAGMYEFIGARLARMTNARLIVYLHTPFPAERAVRGDKYFARLHAYCMRQLARSAHLAVTLSQEAADYYVTAGLPADKVLVCPVGVPEDFLRRGVMLARNRPPLADRRSCTIGFLGSLASWHRVDILLDALRRLEPGAGWRLAVVGQGQEYAKLRRLAREWGIEARVEWLGALSREKAFEEVARFDIAVLPNTLIAPATPMKLFEYAALARPIIAPDRPNVRALFTEAEICFFTPDDPVALASALRTLRAAPEKARQRGERAQERIRGYTAEIVLARLLDRAVALGMNGNGSNVWSKRRAQIRL